MTEITNHSLPDAHEDQSQQETLTEHFRDWVRTELIWYAGSFSIHLLGLSLLLLLPTVRGGDNPGDAPVLISSADEESAQQPETLDPIPPSDPGAIDDVQLPELKLDPIPRLAAEGAEKDKYYDDSSKFVPQRGIPGDAKQLGGSRWQFGHGPELGGVEGPGPGIGPFTGTPGNCGDGPVGDLRGRGHIRKGTGIIAKVQPAVNAALVWLAKHQLYEGNWSLQHYVDCCTDRTCTGTGDVPADAGATAMGLLPFLAAAQTHRSPGPYKEHVRKGIAWLIRHQQPDGNLAKGAQQMMYSHGLATIALAEAYGMTGDRDVGRAAQAAVNFILNAQNTADGGWRYNPGDPGDTSVVGWQLMALKSAHMAGLNVGGSVFSGTSKWLDSVSAHDGAEYAYQPGQGPSPTMTSVGLLCRQYLGANRRDHILTGGMGYLLNHLPDEGVPNVYYWYYATQVMHNMNGAEWDVWNRKMRDVLLRTQVRDVEHCANGSWAPQKDPWGAHGGRLMTTSLSTLTLEVYYRYLPLFKADAEEGN